MPPTLAVAVIQNSLVSMTFLFYVKGAARQHINSEQNTN
jgi:hypothetical protein